MYHCHMRFYFIGRQSGLVETLEEMPPFEGFTHEFFKSDVPKEELAKKADVIIADLRELNAVDTARSLVAAKNPDADLILLAEKPQIMEMLDYPSEMSTGIADIWTLPLSVSELGFHFLKWQQLLKNRIDSWQTGQFLDATINGTPDLIWFKSKDGIHEKVNDSFCRTVNKTKEQIQGRGHAYIWDVEQDDPACIESERIVMERRETIVSEEEVQTGDKTKLLTTYKSPLYDVDGSVMGTVGVGIDITQERAYAEEIIRKNRTLESLFMSLDCGVICHTLDGSRIISINRSALNILGYETQEQMMACGFDLIAHSVMDEDRSKLEESIRSLENVGDSVNIEYRVQHENGKVYHIMGNIKLVEENGEVYCQRFLLDYTDQKLKEEQKRRESKRRQVELIHALSMEYNLVFFFNLDTGLVRPLRIGDCRSGLLEDIFAKEVPAAEAIGRYIEECVHPDDREEMREAMARETMERELSEKEMCYINYRTVCCGDVRYFQMKAARTGDWNVQRGVVVGFHSVDEETRSEMEKKAVLEDALSQANRASKAKSAFLSNMSHDIRTPMNAIIGFTALGLTHIDQKEQVEEYLKKIMSSGNHLLSLINDVLDMSRIESGKIHLEEQPCCLPDILHDLRNILQADIRAKQLDLYMDAVDIRHEEICCDKLRLNQVLLNLMSNAVKYTSAGGMVSLKVIERAGAPAGHAHFEFHVKDTGIGMTEEFVAKIFEPFERERNSTTSGIQGTGLGMAIAKNIVEMMNGTIEVQSKVGVGTECTVSFTFQLDSEGREVQEITELKNVRALVVDDDFNTCDSVSCMLQEIGLRAEWTLSGKEAVLRTRQAKMRNDRYAVYIIDWLLPDMNGVEVARRIRKEMGKDVPIIVLTAYDWSDIESEAIEAGVTAFCSKPLFLSELQDCLYSIVNKDKEEKVSTVRKARHTGRILLAEDNELNREIAETILEEAGFEIESAENGQIALDMLEQSKPGYYQVILMDVQMPVMGGYEATRRIRELKNSELSSIPILAMTANAFEEDKQKALLSGMNGHIAKPIDIAKLMETLDEILDEAQA